MALYFFEAESGQEPVVDKGDISRGEVMVPLVSGAGSVTELKAEKDITDSTPRRYHLAEDIQVLVTPTSPDTGVVRFRTPTGLPEGAPKFNQAYVSADTMVIFHDPVPETATTKVAAIVFRGPRVR